jgi:omega-amidase
VQILAALAQASVTRDVAANTELAVAIVREKSSADLIVFPEGLVSGYSEDLSWLAEADMGAIRQGFDALAAVAKETATAVWAGSLILRDGVWRNAALGFSPDGKRFEYEKVNLASREREKLAPGYALPVIQFPLAGQVVPVGIQICREARHPEQWRVLAASGAKLFIHLNNALVDEKPNRDVWRSLLISRAVENQRFVLSANAAGSYQRVPTMAVAPDGEVIGECAPDEPTVLEVSFDLAAVSNAYLEQVRRDLVADMPGSPPRQEAG